MYGGHSPTVLLRAVDVRSWGWAGALAELQASMLKEGAEFKDLPLAADLAILTVGEFGAIMLQGGIIFSGDHLCYFPAVQSLCSKLNSLSRYAPLSTALRCPLHASLIFA